MSGSVARRVAARGTAILLGSLLVVGVGTGAALHVQQVRALDQALLAAALRRAHPDLETDGDDHHQPEVETRILVRNDPVVPREALERATDSDEPVFVSWHGQRMVLLPVEIHDREGEHHLVVSGSAPEPVLSRTVGGFALAYGGLALVVALAASGALLGVVRSSFAPVERARREAQSVLGFGQGARLTEEGPDEILSLLQAVNGLLGRLDAAWAAQGRFTSEAAHELRTPVTALQGEIEVALRKPRTAAEYRATLVSVHEEADRLGRVVQALLALARLDAGEAERSRELVRAREIVAGALASEGPALEAAGCPVTVALGADPELEVHVPLLELALANLLRNAAHHAKGAPVAIRVVALADHVAFEVSDGGPGVPADEAEQLFDRFARAATARRDDPAGLGLGLPLAREVARRHGGTCVLERADRGGTLARLTVRLPDRRVGGFQPEPHRAPRSGGEALDSQGG